MKEHIVNEEMILIGHSLGAYTSLNVINLLPQIKKAVIIVPASFDDDARKATIEAGQIAGFEVKTIVNEPTAACLAYSVTKNIFD